MAKDYGKILTEEYRQAKIVGKSRKSQANQDWDFERGSMRRTSRANGWDMILQGDHVTPLLRCLESNVGRPWNTVYSELLASCKGKMDRYHLRQHIGFAVTLPNEPRTFWTRRRELYVDDNGILRLGENAAHSTPDRILVKEGIQYLQLDNGWWLQILRRETSFYKFNENEYKTPVVDARFVCNKVRHHGVLCWNGSSWTEKWEVSMEEAAAIYKYTYGNQWMYDSLSPDYIFGVWQKVGEKRCKKLDLPYYRKVG